MCSQEDNIEYNNIERKELNDLRQLVVVPGAGGLGWGLTKNFKGEVAIILFWLISPRKLYENETKLDREQRPFPPPYPEPLM